MPGVGPIGQIQGHIPGLDAMAQGVSLLGQVASKFGEIGGLGQLFKGSGIAGATDGAPVAAGGAAGAGELAELAPLAAL